MRACVFARCAVLGLLVSLMASSSVWAQYELRSVAFNPLFQDPTGPAKAPGTDPLVPAPSQFASAKITGGSVAALYRREYGPQALPNAGATWSDSEAALAVTSSAVGVTLQVGDIVTLTGAGAFRETRSYNGTTWVIGNVVRYAAAVYTPATAADAGNAVVLVRAVLGAALQPDAPRYLFGEVIARPAKTADGTKDTTGDLAEYWLSRPMTPGEPFDLGDGTIHTPPGVTGSEPYYFSIHANAVFASQAGRVSITWRSRAKETFTNGSGASVTQFRIKAEDFFVSAASLRPSRTIFWTQKQFKGPAVSIPLGSIQVVRPIYNAAMPREVNGVKYAADGVAVIKDSEEYLPESGQRELPVEVRTLWFDSTTSALRAYNRTGRLMVEYLGEQQAQPIEPGAHVFLGADVVDVVQQAPQIDAVVELGERITPRDRGNAEVANSSAWIGRDSQAGQTGGAGYYHTVTLADGTKTFYAEKENLSPANVVFYWLERLAPALTTGAAAAVANITLEWPKQKNGYRLLWPEVDPANPASGLARYAHNTVATAGSPLGTGVQFAAGQLPLLAFQDGPAATLQAEVNTSTQRFTVSLSNDGLNRSLIRFGSGSNVWYVRVYTQAEDSAGFLEGDGGAAIRSNGVPNAIVGTRLQPPSADYISAGYIAHGRGYSEAAYVDPFVAGATLASSGAIIPVNAIPGDKDLVVWWFKVVKPPAGSPFQPFYVPAKLGRYTIGYPSNAPKIVMAADGNKEGGTPSGGELSTAQEKLGKLYVQNVRTGIGFNPNEEHALLSSGDGRVYALRDDINDTGSNPASYTSEPFILWSYKATDGRPAMKVFQVLRETAIDRFSYDARVPSPVRGPMPLGELDIPTDSSGASKNFESTPLDGVHQQPNLPATQAAYDRYNRFTWEERNGQHWIYRGPHNDATSATALTMQFYYPMRSDFYLPPEEPAVAVGSPLPYLRAKRADGSGYVGTVTAGPPLNITFLPKWNPADPELEVTDTLTVAKDGLPAIYSQSSSEVLYQRSIAQGGPGKPSVVLYDPLREKEFFLGAPNQLQALPKSALVTLYQGKTYFQGLPPHLQKRFFYDALRGPVGAVKGALVLKGQFIAGEDYLHLNVLTPEEEIALKALVPEKDGSGVILPEKVLWDAAITGLATQVETFVKNPDVPGKYKVGPSVTVNARSAAEVTDPDRLSSPGYAAATASETAVVNYALTATGKGDGWVTMVFGNGRNPDQTPAGNSVSVKTFRVRPRLYRGAVKVLKSDNPLDEKVTLRHTGAFMAAPTDTALPYEFEWRYLSASSASGKAVYTISASSLLGGTFLQVMNPTDALPTAAEYSGGQSVSSAPQIVGVAIGDRPIAVLKSVSGVDFTAGVPDNLIFSGEFGAAIGFTLYVEGLPVLTSNRVNSADSVVPQNGLIGVGLAKQYALPGHFFQRKINRVEIAVYAAQGANITVSASPVQFQLHALVDNVSGVWTEATVAAGKPALGHIITVGGNPSAPLGNPLLMLGDNYFTVRYRPKTGKIYRAPTINGADPSETSQYAWSRWTEPEIVEGWIKRVLAQVNPFNQRVKDLANNAVNTDVSMLTQAGKRWEGDVPLALDEINNVGLIEFYETILNRAQAFSIDAATNNAEANKALLLAAGYLSDLYTILGNEAYADAANSTISVDDATTATEVNTSRFAFESQVTSVLEEELALLRGRDNLNSSPGVQKPPAYNRLYWNYTGGINSGQAIYALNYNVREKAGSSTADGRVDAADAQRMFPQGHGDAYGHYLTALTGFYRLLQNSHFTWVPTSETWKVFNQDVEVDYQDERRFARAAANVASTAQQIVALTHRQSYQDGASGWQQFEVDPVSPNRHWGLDDWVSRATQGAYYHWMVGNAILPDKDTNPAHSGVQVIDRTTVPELVSLATLAMSFQTTLDGANARLNPLGLSPGAIAFDISPADLKAGRSHYEQINDRALRAVLNAKGAFDQAAKMTRLLRNQENQTDDANTALVDQENAFRKQLIELYGTPYAGDIGAGKTWAQGYIGPDTRNWAVIDRPTGLVDTTPPISVALQVGVNLTEPTIFTDLTKAYTDPTQVVTKSFLIQPNSFVQYADTFFRSVTATPGSRGVVGKLQQALLDAQQARGALIATVDDLGDAVALFSRRQKLYSQMVTMQESTLGRVGTANHQIDNLNKERANLAIAADFMALGAETTRNIFNGMSELPPKSLGFLASDVTSSARGGLQIFGATVGSLFDLSAISMRAQAQLIEVDMAAKQADADYAVTQFGFTYEQAQAVYEYEAQLRSLVSSHYKLDQLATDLQRKNERVRTLQAEGNQLQLDKELFRQRAAAKVQGFRTRDFTFRTFRNEALEQYRALFDLAGRYTYLAAKAYDYETGLLGSASGQGVISGIVAARSLGDLTGGTPQATVSTLGDSGLAGTMARMQTDWSVAKGRLGINNPDQNGTLFSLRREYFRVGDIPDNETHTQDWKTQLQHAWRPDLLAVPGVAAVCRNLANGTGKPVPGFLFTFRTTIQHGFNFFGNAINGSDHAFSASNFATKIYSVGVSFRGYEGMDPYRPGATTPTYASTSADVLSATPYAYLVPVGSDYMLAPPLGDQATERIWKVSDQALPLPFNLGASSFSTAQFHTATSSLTESPAIMRTHQAFRPVSDPNFFYSTVPAEFTTSRLVGRSVWNDSWILVIPAYMLHSDEQTAGDRFIKTVTDIQLFLRTYSHAGN